MWYRFKFVPLIGKVDPHQLIDYRVSVQLNPQWVSDTKDMFGDRHVVCVI